MIERELIEQGQPVLRRRVFTQAEFEAFARLSGDDNPIHVDPEFAARTRFGRPVAHGMFLYGVICGLLQALFPGAIQLEQQLVFPAPTFAGDEMTLRIDLLEKPAAGLLALKTDLFNPAGELTVDGLTMLRWPPAGCGEIE